MHYMLSKLSSHERPRVYTLNIACEEDDTFNEDGSLVCLSGGRRRPDILEHLGEQIGPKSPFFMAGPLWSETSKNPDVQKY